MCLQSLPLDKFLTFFAYDFFVIFGTFDGFIKSYKI